MNYIAKTTISIMMMAALSACGGGGGDDSPKARTQAEIRAVAQLGLVNTESMMTRAEIVLGLVGLTVIGQSSVSSGSTGPATSSCATGTGGTGTRTISITKSAPRVGFAPGDVLVVTYANCSASTGATLATGTATLTATNAIANATSSNADLQFRFDTTGLTTSKGGTPSTATGSVNARLKLASDTIELSYVVPGDKIYRTVDDSLGLTTVHGAGGSFSVIAGTTSDRETHRMEGNLIIGTTTSSTQSLLTVSTTGVSGTTASGRFIATSGTLLTKETNQNIATSLVFNTSSVTVSGDTNADGSLDLSFPSTWASLLVI